MPVAPRHERVRVSPRDPRAPRAPPPRPAPRPAQAAARRGTRRLVARARAPPGVARLSSASSWARLGTHARARARRAGWSCASSRHRSRAKANPTRVSCTRSAPQSRGGLERSCGGPERSRGGPGRGASRGAARGQEDEPPAAAGGGGDGNGSKGGDGAGPGDWLLAIFERGNR